MNFYLSARKLDITSGGDMSCIISEVDASEFGVKAGDSLELNWDGLDTPFMVSIDTTDTLVEQGEVAFYEDIWDRKGLSFGLPIQLSFVEPSLGIDPIRRKLKGEELNYDDFMHIMKDIASGKLNTILTTFFAAAGYSPGFNQNEILAMTKALANSGDKLEFEGIVADKHSIGGVAGKGITPIVVPIIASFENVKVPNTSTKAVTSASATTDMLEVIMPMSFSKSQLEEIMKKHNAFMVWGGGLALAPADDEIIEVQKPLGMESIDKFVSSIVAKKVAQGVNHVVFDVPVGKGAKITDEEFPIVKSTFEKICKEFNVNVKVFRRDVRGIDGYAVGPSLECREFLRVFEKHPERSLQLENDAVEIAGALIELCGFAAEGEGKKVAQEKLNNGEAKAKLSEIISLQGGNGNISSDDLELGGVKYEVLAEKNGKILHIDNKKIFSVCKSLGNPRVKEAGIYFKKVVNDEFTKGEVLVTIYATSESRLELAKKVWEKEQPLEIEEFI